MTTYWTTVAVEMLCHLPREPLSDGARFTAARRPSPLGRRAVEVLVEDPNAPPDYEGKVVEVLLTRNYATGAVTITGREVAP